jgi:HSP20 family protein
MALIRWFGEGDAWRSMEQQLGQMQRDFQKLWGGGAGTRLFPAMNIYDDGESFIVRAEVPGVGPDKIDVSVTGDTLTIRGKREIEPAGKDCCYHRRERDGGEFRRAFNLPDQVDTHKVMATVKDGILEVRLPRAESSKQRKIQVQAS